jgi:autotransporter-associated beta strand protein
MLRHRTILASLILAAYAPLALSADFWWQGELSSNWSTTVAPGGTIINTNWATTSAGTTDRLRLPVSTDLVRFATSPAFNLATTISGSQSIAGISVDNVAAHPSISGGSITVGTSGISVNTTATLSISSGITSNQPQFSLNTALAGSNLVLSGPVSGSSALTKTGPGTLTLGGTNTYAGQTTLTSGTLTLASAAALPPGRNLTILQGTLNIASYSPSIGALILGDATDTPRITSAPGGLLQIGGSITYNGGGPPALIQCPLSLSTGTHDFGNADAQYSTAYYDTVISAPISGAGGLTKSGIPYLALTAPSSYAGATTITNGALFLAAASALPSTTQLNITASVVSLYCPNTENGVTAGSYNQTIASLSGSNSYLDLGSANLTINGSSSTTFAGEIQGTGGSLALGGTTTLTLSGINSYTGPTSLSGGTLKIASSSSLPASSNVNIYKGTLDILGHSVTVNDLYFGYSVGGRYPAILTNSSPTPATVTLQGNVTYNVTELFFDEPAKLQTALVLTPGLHTFTNTDFQTSFHDYNLIVSGPITGTGGLVKGGHTKVVLAAQNSYLGPTNIGNGTLYLAATNALPATTAVTVTGTLSLSPPLTAHGITAGSYNQTIASLTGPGSINLGSATLTVGDANSTTFSGNISGTGGSLVKQDTGTLTLSGTNSYTGTTTILDGTLKLASSTALPPGRDLHILNGAFDTAGLSASVDNIYIGPGTLDPESHARISSSGSQTGGITVNGNINYQGWGGSFASFATIGAPLYLPPGSHLIYTPAYGGASYGFDIAFWSPITGPGGVSITSHARTIFFERNTYQGQTLISGDLFAGAPDALPTTTDLIVNGGLYLYIPQSASYIGGGLHYNQTVGSVAGLGYIDLGPSNLYFGNTTNSSASVGIYGTGNLIKQGSGTFTLIRPPSFTGATSVWDGKFIFDCHSITGSYLGVHSSGSAEFTPGGDHILRTQQLYLAGPLTTHDNSIILDYTGSSPIATLIGYLNSDRLLPDPAYLGLPTTLAIAEAADLGLTEFAGLAIDDTTVILKYTYVGDANLDGQVDALDYERIDLAIGNTGVLGTAQGDLNYDGNVDALDYEQVDLNIGNGVGAPLGTLEGARFIPEPTTIPVLALILLVPRRSAGSHHGR